MVFFVRESLKQEVAELMELSPVHHPGKCHACDLMGSCSLCQQEEG
jgi:NADH dehydrogenase/NADH:ubiquinone oxidoreductase subunit G